MNVELQLTRGPRHWEVPRFLPITLEAILEHSATARDGSIRV
jgi:hypothetical protein